MEALNVRDLSKAVILITGAAGFIASHVTDHLLEQYPNCQIVVYDILDYCANTKNISASERCHFVRGDILETDQVRQTLLDYKVNVIMHFAAQSHVDSSIVAPLHHTRTNCLGTQSMLEATRSIAPQIECFIHVSTDEVYGGEGGHLDELTRMNPTNPYSASKAAAECFVNAYYKTYKLPLIITRANNIYGPRQFPEKVIPKFTYRLLRGKPCCLHGGGNTVRHFLHTSDIARAFEVVLLRGHIGQSYNIGADEEFSMKEVAHIIHSEMAARNCLPENVRRLEDAVIIVEDRKFNDQRYFVKDDRIRSLGWKPEIPFSKGISDTVGWYVDHPDYWTDIEEYLEPHPGNK